MGNPVEQQGEKMRKVARLLCRAYVDRVCQKEEGSSTIITQDIFSPTQEQASSSRLFPLEHFCMPVDRNVAIGTDRTGSRMVLL